MTPIVNAVAATHQEMQGLSLRNKFKAWAALSRAPFHTVGVFPFVLGATIAWGMGFAIDWAVLLLSSFALILIMLTTYLAGEYYDSETDSINASYNRFSGGSRVLQMGLISRRGPLVASYVCVAGAIIVGLVLQFHYKTGPYTLLLGAFGFFCGYFYTARPIQWAYRGVGEILISVCYGWLTVNAAYYLQTGSFHPVATLVSIPLAMSIFLVILINEFPDCPSDALSGKRTLVVRFGRERMAILYAILSIACFLSVFGLFFYEVPWIIAPLSLFVLLLVAWNIVAVGQKGYEDRKLLQGICGRTILLDLTIAGIYIVAFLLRRSVDSF
ncbi:prenyltransferase [Chloroflexota bacterium]